MAEPATPIKSERLSSPSTGHTLLAARLRARRNEIEAEMLARISAIDPDLVADSFRGGELRDAVVPALDYALAILEHGPRRTLPVPAILLAQARVAARRRISLDTFFRRYFAGHAVFCDFLTEEAEGVALSKGASLKPLLRVQALHCDRLLAAISREHARESQVHVGSIRSFRSEQVERLLAGELIDSAELDYPFDGWHLAVITKGPELVGHFRRLARELDRRLLLLKRSEGTIWAWFGGGRRLDFADLRRSLSSLGPDNPVAVGEPAERLAGWRLTHRQANAALSVALRSDDKLVRYADVALLASVLQDDLLLTSLRELYLAPLERERDGGGTARETLHAYFAAERNVSSAAAALGVKRHTVTSRLRAVEERFGRKLNSCASEVEAALHLEDLSGTQG